MGTILTIEGLLQGVKDGSGHVEFDSFCVDRLNVWLQVCERGHGLDRLLPVSNYLVKYHILEEPN